MPILNSLAALKEEMTAWRRDLHAHPETAFEEVRTAGIVADKLAGWGIEVHRGLAETGVVGVLRGRQAGGRTIGLRADMDALAMEEETGLPYCSRHPGKFHGCGHDGHTTMLLGAAKYLSETRNFAGTVHLIFQPGEEGAGGGRRMIEEGLFERFPCDEVYALHNWPDLPVGHVGLRAGPMMAASDEFEIMVRAAGGHAAMPHQCIDPIVIGAQIITALQTLVSRALDPVESAVISITQMHAGTTHNVIPSEAWLAGTLRTFRPAIQAAMKAGLERTIQGVAAAMGASAMIRYKNGYPATVNHLAQVREAAAAAAQVVGPDKVDAEAPPVMGAEDFSFMLQAVPGAYLWLGQAGGPSACGVHNPGYDFNDEILPIGASLFATLVERRLRDGA